jgi:hypothetical protein
VSCSSDSTAGTQVGNEFTLSGVAATGYALSQSEVRFESKNKVLASTFTDSLGRFNIDVSESVLELNKVYYLRSDSSVGAPFFLEIDNQKDTLFVLMHPVGDYLAKLTDSVLSFKTKAGFTTWQDSVLSSLLGPGVKSEEVFHNRGFVAAKELSRDKFSPWDLIIHTVSDSAKRAGIPPHELMRQISKTPSYLLADSLWRELLANQAGYLGMSEEELLTNLEIWLAQDKSKYDLPKEISNPHKEGDKKAFKDGYEGRNQFLFHGLINSLTTQYGFSDQPAVKESASDLQMAILSVWNLNQRNIGAPLQTDTTPFYIEFADNLQVYIASSYVTSFEIDMWKKPEFAEVFKELWDRNINPILLVGSFDQLPEGVGPNPSSAYWSADKNTILVAFENLDKAQIQIWINEIIAEYPSNPFGTTWTPRAKIISK